MLIHLSCSFFPGLSFYVLPVSIFPTACPLRHFRSLSTLSFPRSVGRKSRETIQGPYILLDPCPRLKNLGDDEISRGWLWVDNIEITRSTKTLGRIKRGRLQGLCTSWMATINRYRQSAKHRAVRYSAVQQEREKETGSGVIEKVAGNKRISLLQCPDACG